MEFDTCDFHMKEAILKNFVVKQGIPEFCMYRILSLPALRQAAAQEEEQIWELEHLRTPESE